jgi:hypothetical protein
MLDTPSDAVPHPLGTQRSLFAVLLLLGAVVVGGCGDGDGTVYDMGWLMGASSTFEATTEGIVEGSMAGTAAFRMDENGNLVGIELMHIDDSTRGISIELEPRPVELRSDDGRTYEVVPLGLMGTERPDSQAGFMAFFEMEGHSFQASRGTLHVVQSSRSSVQGSFEVEMESHAAADGGVTPGDVTVHGTFQATRVRR